MGLATKDCGVGTDYEVVPANRPALRQGRPVTLKMPDGALIAGEWRCDTATPKAVVCLSHAMMVDRRTLDSPPGAGLLTALLAAGLQVFWFDQRGHGQSQGTVWDYDKLVGDAARVAAYVSSVQPGLPQVAVGHSLFAHVALAWQAVSMDFPAARRFDGLVLLAGNVWHPAFEPLWWRLAVKRLVFSGLVAVAKPFGRLPAVRFSLGTADEPLPYLQQMNSWMTGQDYADRQGHSYRQKLRRVNVPILSVSGATDRLLAVPACQLRFVSETAGPITHWQVGRRFGDAVDPDHMGLVLSNKLSPVFHDVAAWIATPGRF